MKAVMHTGFNRGPKNKRPIIAVVNAIIRAIKNRMKRLRIV